MTRRLVLLNLSNYENEDYGVANGPTLAPGEYMDVSECAKGPDGAILLEVYEATNPEAPGKYKEASFKARLA